MRCSPLSRAARSPRHDIIAGPFPDECAARDDKDKCEKAKMSSPTPSAAIDWATTNEQNALKKIASSRAAPAARRRRALRQLTFDGVKPKFERRWRTR